MHRLSRVAPFALLALAAVASAGCNSRTSAPQTRVEHPAAASPSPTYAPSSTYTPPPSYAAASSPSSAPTQPAFAPSRGGPIPYDAKDITVEQALAAGRAAGKPVAFYILSSTCGFCTRLESTTLTDGTVQREMGRFYNVRIDSRSAAGTTIAHQYARSGYPQTTVLDASGSVRGGVIGYEEPGRYSRDLANIH